MKKILQWISMFSVSLYMVFSLSYILFLMNDRYKVDKEKNELNINLLKTEYGFKELQDKFLDLKIENGNLKKRLEIVKHISNYNKELDSNTILRICDGVFNSSSKLGLDPLLIFSVIQEESRYDPKALSSDGAVSLMQIKPNTKNYIDKKFNSIDKTNMIYENISLGSHYLLELISKYNNIECALLAYNMGPNKLDELSSKKVFIKNNYAKKVLLTYERIKEKVEEYG